MHSNTDYIIDYDKFYNTTENKVGSQVLTAFDYGTNNNILQKVTYGNGQTVNYNYDKYGNVKELFYNGKLAFSFLSDKTGTVMRHKDFVNNRQYDYDYDTTGRLVRQVKTDISKTDAENKFVSAYEYDYDLNNNVTKLASKNGDSSIVHSFTYGKDNLLTEYSSDVSSKVTYTYDGLNRQTKSSVALKTPLDMSYTYYDSNRGENFTTTKIKEETIGKDTYKYEYDTNGNITDIYKKVNNDWQRLYLYEYDEFNQLITSCDYINQKQYRYDYDEAGNILTETVSRIGAHGQLYDSRVNTYGYDDANWGDKLTSYNGETITYDEIGNPLSYRDGMEMTWLNGRKLTTLQSGNDSISYKYDSNGVRTSKTVNGVEYTYEYLNGQLMHETRGEKVFDYCYDANGQLYAVSYKANSSTDAVTYYFAHNWRGDITSIYDGDGNMVAKYEYDDWGNVLTVSNASNQAITDPNHIANLNPFRYRNYYYDSESGLYYLMSRYYDPVVHRFLNADGYLQAGEDILDVNMFAYCGNNPVCRIDSKGNSWWGIALACFATVAVCAVAVVAAPVIATAAVGVGIAATASSVITASVGVATIATCVGVYAGVKHISQSTSNSKSSSSKSYDALPRNHTVYGLVDSNGNTQYVGRTTNPEKRENAHANNPQRSHLNLVPIATGLNAIEARGVEQIQMMYHHTVNTSNKMNNQINGISPRNPNLSMYMEAGRGVLSYLENKISNEILYWSGN